MIHTFYIGTNNQRRLNMRKSVVWKCPPSNYAKAFKQLHSKTQQEWLAIFGHWIVEVVE